MDTIERESTDQLCKTLEGVKGASSVDREGDKICIRFKDKDQDELVVMIHSQDDQLLRATTWIVLPPDNIFAALVAVNAWNNNDIPVSHGTFSCMNQIEDKTIAIIGSDLALTGGVTPDHIRSWIEQMLMDINKWEEALLETWKNVPDDNHIQSNQGGDGIASQFAGQVEQTFITTAAQKVVQWAFGG